MDGRKSDRDAKTSEVGGNFCICEDRSGERKASQVKEGRMAADPGGLRTNQGFMWICWWEKVFFPV